GGEADHLAHHDPGDHRAEEAAHAAHHDHHERLDDHGDAPVGVGAAHGTGEGAREPGQPAADAEDEQPDPIEIHAEGAHNHRSAAARADDETEVGAGHEG